MEGLAESFGYIKVSLCWVPAVVVVRDSVTTVIFTVQSLFGNNFRVPSWYFLQISCKIYFALRCDLVNHTARLWQKGGRQILWNIIYLLCDLLQAMVKEGLPINS